MNLEFFPLPMALSLGILIILLILLRPKRSRSHLLCFGLFWLYLIAVVSLVIFPIPLVDASIPRQPISDILARINWMPLNFGYLFYANPTTIFEQLFGNILLTIPLGFGLPWIGHFKPRRLFWLAAASGFAIEMLQLGACLIIGFGYRGIDINDALLNSSGTLLGYATLRGFSYLFLKLVKNKEIKPGGLLAYAQAVALGGSAAPERILKT